MHQNIRADDSDEINEMTTEFSSSIPTDLHSLHIKEEKVTSGWDYLFVSQFLPLFPSVL